MDLRDSWTCHQCSERKDIWQPRLVRRRQRGLHELPHFAAVGGSKNGSPPPLLSHPGANLQLIAVIPFSVAAADATLLEPTTTRDLPKFGK